MVLTAGGGVRDSNTHSSDIYNIPGLTAVNYGVNGLSCQDVVQFGITCPASSNIHSTTSGKIYNASFRRDFESGNLNITYNQQLNPSSTGSQQQTQTFTLASNYDFSDRLKLGFSGSYSEITAIAGYLSSQASYAYLNRNMLTLSPNCRWDWTPEVNLQLSYIYYNQHYTQVNQTAIADSIQFQINYQPQINRQVK